MNCFCCETIIGNITIYANEKAVTRLCFRKCSNAATENTETEIIKVAFIQLHEYLDGSRTVFDLKLEYGGSGFQTSVWDQLRKIPYGKTMKYKEIARDLGSSKSCRAVGIACGKNPISIFIPCHRVIGSNGNLTGYGGGLHIKSTFWRWKKRFQMQLTHPFEPVFGEKSRILILGTFPSVKSREYGFYYGHPQNRFWKVLARITNTDPIPETIADKKQMLLKNGIALADMLQSCDIESSGDGSIRNAAPADLSKIFDNANIERIYANGEKAYQLFIKYIGMEVIKLPSTSPANAKYDLEKLIFEWEKIII
ncbi:MAG: DNA-deoxyinosine glycosylase [Holosporaceae bacterium]|jgi:hypoxanthine-DNA glycosylase|nr:DNA-deoxyinosine glycosylase [Holosporaceae bacterium]